MSLALKRLAPFAALLVAALAPAPAAAATKIERIVSPSGIEAWLVRETAAPLIAIDFAFRGGSRQDPADKPGVANLTADLMDEGAGELDAHAFQRRIEEHAIEFSFKNDRDYFRGSLRTLVDHRDVAFDLLRLALTAPRFDADAIERMRTATLSSLRRATTSPSDIASTTWWANAFPDHPYGRRTNGTLESVAAIDANDIRTFFRRSVARDNLKVAIVGDIDRDTAAKMLDHVFGALPARADLTPTANAAPQKLGERAVIDLDVPQTVIAFGAPGLVRKDPDFFAAFIVNHILGGGSFSSRLYNEVREKRGLAYSIYTYLSTLENAPLFLGSTATRADKAGETIDIILSEMQRMAKDGPTADELARAKAYLKGSYPLAFDTSTKVAGQLLSMQLDDLGIDYIERRGAMIDAVTLDHAKHAAKRLLDSGLFITVVGRASGLATKREGG